ncbi:type VII toxin-antitoxin system HepT family RNase toxin [Lysinibacillus sp. NPDC047702]|uniref:type VII toxin-antitoxin system HepT family RNase toxin n=1 Tax=unclassified Lysinibacillus TaxID=2636778 RepID=UPI003D079C5B
MNNDVVLNKVATIERCVNRVREVYGDNPRNLMDFTKQDSIILNIQRACEASIDLVMHIVSDLKLGLPKTSREAFKLLEENNIINHALAKTLMNMVGFRNIAVHDYQTIELNILQAIIENHLNDFKIFTAEILLM